MDSAFIQFLTTQVGLGGLAALALWLNGRAYQDALRREREYAESNREDKKQMYAIMQENTRALVALQAAIERAQWQGTTPSKHDSHGTGD
jgi:hypothetical protein